MTTHTRLHRHSVVFAIAFVLSSCGARLTESEELQAGFLVSLGADEIRTPGVTGQARPPCTAYFVEVESRTDGEHESTFVYSRASDRVGFEDLSHGRVLLFTVSASTPAASRVVVERADLARRTLEVLPDDAFGFDRAPTTWSATSALGVLPDEWDGLRASGRTREAFGREFEAWTGDAREVWWNDALGVALSVTSERDGVRCERRLVHLQLEEDAELLRDLDRRFPDFTRAVAAAPAPR